MPDRTNGDTFNDALRQFMPMYFRFINPVLHSFKSEKYRLHENQIKVIMAVGLLGKASPSQLSRVLLIQKGSLTTIIQSLISARLLSRKSDPDDARKYDLSITQNGKDFIKEKSALDTQCFDAMLKGMPKSDLETVCAGLNTLTNYLTKAGTQ